MKKFAFLFALILVLGLSAFAGKSDWYVEADYFSHQFQIRPGDYFDESNSGFGWYYAGYDFDGQWELGVSYFEWSAELVMSSTFSHQVDLYPGVFYIQYKPVSSKNADWEPILGIGYGSANVVWRNIDKTNSGWNYMESHRYDVFAWTLGVRYFFNNNWALNLRYIRHEIDIPYGHILGAGYNIGVTYKF
ncbi:MAG: outer membrane beta-barrel protein [bacterium]|nr:outer membrane beta-barrel protein [bacterium]